MSVNSLELRMALKGMRRALDVMDTALEEDVFVRIERKRQERIDTRLQQCIEQLDIILFESDEEASKHLYYRDPNNKQTFLPTVSAVIHFLRKR
jgi:hypothetical protein